MEIPIPPSVNLSPLEALLAKSKKIMNIVESTAPVKQVDNSHTSTNGYEDDNSYHNNYSRNNRQRMDDDYGYDERDEREPVYENYQATPSSEPYTYTAEQVMASKLPQNIKELMIRNPIPQFQVPPSKVSAEAISKMTGAPIRDNQAQAQLQAQRQAQQSRQQIINEGSRQHSSDMITISRSELKDMINEGISTFFKQVYDKTLTEETIKKTINVLIKEGKINVKKKV